MEMKIRLMEEFEEHMPETTKYALGYISLPNAGYAVKMISMQCTQTMLLIQILLWCDSVRIVMRSIPKVSDIRVM